MALPLQPVSDPATNQNFQEVAKRFPLARKDLAKSSAGPEQLSSAAKELFLQLVLAGACKLDIGSTTIKFPGGTTTSEVKTINHGLNAVPLWAFPIPLRSEAGSVPFTPNLIEGSLNSTSFKARLLSSAVTAEATISVLWIAIG